MSQSRDTNYSICMVQKTKMSQFASLVTVRASVRVLSRYVSGSSVIQSRHVMRTTTGNCILTIYVTRQSQREIIVYANMYTELNLKENFPKKTAPNFCSHVWQSKIDIRFDRHLTMTNQNRI